MPDLVKIFIDDDGIAVDDPVWHLIDPISGEVFCTNEVFGFGESDDVVYKTKHVERGGITCPACIHNLKVYKAIRL